MLWFLLFPFLPFYSDRQRDQTWAYMMLFDPLYKSYQGREQIRGRPGCVPEFEGPEFEVLRCDGPGEISVDL